MRRREDPAPVISARMDSARQKKLAETRERARKVAEIVARLPKDRAQVPDSAARADLLDLFGLTAAMEADGGRFHDHPVDFVGRILDYTAGHRKDEGEWIRDEFYMPSLAEVRQIAAEELDRARRPGSDH
jgi:hypothetical protein